MREHSRRSSNEPRRKYKRFRAPRTGVVCTVRGFWASLFRRNVALHVKDLSLGGAQIIASRPLRTGIKADVILDFPGFPRPLAAEADVRWCRRDTLSLEPRWNAGLIFKRLSPADEEQLREVDRIYLG
jgi:hypothetical protein